MLNYEQLFGVPRQRFAIASCTKDIACLQLISYNKIPNHLLDSDRATVEIDTSLRSSTTESFGISRSKKVAFLLSEFSERRQHSASILQETGKNPVELPYYALRRGKIKEKIRNICTRRSEKKQKRNHIQTNKQT